jgi:hypothetical protein
VHAWTRVSGFRGQTKLAPSPKRTTSKVSAILFSPKCKVRRSTKALLSDAVTALLESLTPFMRRSVAANLGLERLSVFGGRRLRA